MDRILLNGMVFFGYHGCLAAEKQLGQRFIVDVEVECDLQPAGQSDQLEDTLDYVQLYEIARRLVEGSPVNLLEALAEQIAAEILNSSRAQSVLVKIRKPHVALRGPLDSLGVEIFRTRTP